jgi:AraC-like DNA-binding protein
MLDKALLFDGSGNPVRQGHCTVSRDWDEVQAFCRNAYMPYVVTPLGKLSRPDATMYSANIGRITATRFSYGVPIHLDRFDPAAGKILVLTTLRGHLRHMLHGTTDATTSAGDAFVADCSRTDYWLDGDGDHMQFNLTIDHDLMEKVAFREYGHVPGDSLWTSRVKLGDGKRWLALMEYAASVIAAERQEAASGRIGRHLEEMICHELLRQWAAGVGHDLATGARQAAPHYVRAAERVLADRAREAPTISDVASNLGISVRSLSEGFRRFRGTTPRQFLKERRLEGLRRELLATEGKTVAQIAADWGYMNFGVLAASYRNRFGELPSQTLYRHRYR